MRNRTLMILAAVTAILLWAGLAAFANLRPPSPVNQVTFLAIWAACVLFTVMPLSYAFNARLSPRLGRSGDLMRATRQGFLAAVLATVLMALRFLYILTLASALVLAAIVFLVELLFFLRSD